MSVLPFICFSCSLTIEEVDVIPFLIFDSKFVWNLKKISNHTFLETKNVVSPKIFLQTKIINTFCFSNLFIFNFLSNKLFYLNPICKFSKCKLFISFIKGMAKFVCWRVFTDWTTNRKTNENSWSFFGNSA